MILVLLASVDATKTFNWDNFCSLDNDTVANFISVLGWMISVVIMYYTYSQVKLIVKNRNLGFSSDADKMLIEKPQLWEFYDSHVGKFSERFDDEYKTQKDFVFVGKEIITIEDCFGVTVSSNEKIKICFYIGHKKMFERKMHTITFGHHGRARIETSGHTTLRKNEPFTLRQFSLDSRQLDAQLDAFTYFMLNHFEVILLEKNEDTYPGWRRYMQYCMRKSERFRSKLEKIIEDDVDFRGLYGPRYIRELKNMKREYETKTDV